MLKVLGYKNKGHVRVKRVNKKCLNDIDKKEKK